MVGFDLLIGGLVRVSMVELLGMIVFIRFQENEGSHKKMHFRAGIFFSVGFALIN